MIQFFLKNTVIFLESEDGPAAVEYAVMLALILAAVFAIVQAVGIQVGGTFEHARDEITGAINNN
jgi:pilus assembly protein Flp/PilA